MGLDDYINNDEGNCYSGIERATYSYISDEQLAQWAKEHRALPWYRKLGAWWWALKWRLRNWWGNVVR